MLKITTVLTVSLMSKWCSTSLQCPCCQRASMKLTIPFHPKKQPQCACHYAMTPFLNNQPQALSHSLKLPDLNTLTLCNYLQPLLWYVHRLSMNVYVQAPLQVSCPASWWLEKIALAFALSVGCRTTQWGNWWEMEHSCDWGLCCIFLKMADSTTLNKQCLMRTKSSLKSLFLT